MCRKILVMLDYVSNLMDEEGDKGRHSSAEDTMKEV
jgi:hypothetical protein